MDEIKDLSSQEPSQIREQIDETTSGLTEKIESLEIEVKDLIKV